MSSDAERVERRLAAIFAADVAGYCRLMSQDEVGTLRALTSHREVMDRLIAEHRGRIANTAGDSVLAEFPSAVDAVKCAVRVQEALHKGNRPTPEDPVLKFRIGVHAGDVLVRGDDLLGDAVNIAARLQALAEPGAVCISGVMHEYVRKTLPLMYDDLGLQTVKNIDEPVRVFAIRLDGRSTSAGPSPRPVREVLSLPSRPSIAVLPFATTSPEDEYLGDGISDDVTTALSKMRWLFVIARNSAFSFKGRAVEIGQIARQLGVAYILTGSVRRGGNRVRISVQLVEGETGMSLWAERYERDFGDMFALQDEIAESVAGSIEPELLRKESERATVQPAQNPTAWDLVRRAMWEFHKVQRNSHLTARDLLVKAISTARDNVDSHIWLARVDAGIVAYGWTDDPEAISSEGKAAALRAVQLDEKNPYSHYAVAITHSFGGELDRARKAGEQAITLSPSFALGHLVLGIALLLLGQPHEAIPKFERGLRLNPFDPHSFTWHLELGLAHYFVGQPRRALDEANRSLDIRPYWSPALKLAAACEAALGDRLAAQHYTAALREKGDPSADILVKHRPEWVAQIEAVVQSLAADLYKLPAGF
ncbi:adenylate/guanylate cyclase domain-containing protein [Methylobacterium sp. WSM2598]|uniref:adenylate/guanylate cyclase domain-containing protein n=1 Tax=Methylobacterium sp. WSM2598 TaxID=398261 RepID=UPI0012F65C4F|nr:adenylate/guanylate cyclase domain-containing protein [Methylobacterium sp. WSM2598]